MGIAAPVVTPVMLRAGIVRRIAVTTLPAGTAGTEYQLVADCPVYGNPRLSSQVKPAMEPAPSSSVMQRRGLVLLWARLAAPGSPGSDPQALRFSESKAVVKGPPYGRPVTGSTPPRGMGSGFTWQKGSFRPIASL